MVTNLFTQFLGYVFRFGSVEFPTVVRVVSGSFYSLNLKNVKVVYHLFGIVQKD